MIRYYKNNGSLHIGSNSNKITFFLFEKCACITVNGIRKWHFGKW